MSQPLTFNQLCLFLLTVAAVVLVVQLLQTLTQIRRTLAKTNDAIDDFRATLSEIRQIALLVKARAQSLSAALEGFERTAGKLTAVLEQVANYILKPFLLISSLLGGLKTAMAVFGRKKHGGEENVGEQRIDSD
ncbi:MAG: hypothetical protein HYX75_06475 [Acidobacteria bacterium]|nr:hypothetical protein [Acidobacteriota bacterium]